MYLIFKIHLLLYKLIRALLTAFSLFYKYNLKTSFLYFENKGSISTFTLLFSIFFYIF